MWPAQNHDGKIAPRHPMGIEIANSELLMFGKYEYIWIYLDISCQIPVKYLCSLFHVEFEMDVLGTSTRSLQNAPAHLSTDTTPDSLILNVDQGRPEAIAAIGLHPSQL